MSSTAVWILHNYPPVVLGGGEFAAHRINLWLKQNGWTITVYIIPGGLGKESYPAEFEGIPIQTLANPYMFKVPDGAILFSQLWATRMARNMFDAQGCRYIEFVHFVDRTTISPWPWTTKRNFKMIYNSSDTQKRALEIAPWLTDVPSQKINPIIPAVSNISPRTDPTAYPWITLINFSEDKGAVLFNSMAVIDTTHKYVAVRGAHGQQQTPNANVTLLDPTLDMASIWEKTRILVVPSTYETWCMVASEAMAHGIPVIVPDHIPPLKENCDTAAVYVKRDDINAWISAIQTIESDYFTYSTNAIARHKNQESELRTLFNE
jgi:hypothetical protein